MKTGSMGCRLMVLIVFLMIVTWLTPSVAVCANDHLWEIGLQEGWSFDDDKESFNQADILAAYRLPWQWWRWDTLDVGTRLTAAASVLDGGDNTGL